MLVEEASRAVGCVAHTSPVLAVEVAAPAAGPMGLKEAVGKKSIGGDLVRCGSELGKGASQSVAVTA